MSDKNHICSCSSDELKCDYEAERDNLKAGYEAMKAAHLVTDQAYQERYEKAEAEVSRLKGELETWRIDAFTWEGRADEFDRDRDLWESVARGAKEALEKIIGDETEPLTTEGEIAQIALAAFPKEGE